MMECFEKYGSAECSECLWGGSCHFYTVSKNDLPLITQRAVSLNAAKKVALPLPVIEEETPVTTQELATFLSWLLHCDDYTLGIIQEMVINNPQTISELAEQSGVSRSAMHRKILSIIGTDRRLAPMFIALMPKLSRARKRFLRNRK